MRRLWHVWPGQWWPLLPTQEKDFYDKLLEATDGTPSKKVDRDDVTALLNVLRCGTDIETLKIVAPGCQLNKILAAYNLLESRRRQSESAWLAIEEDPSPITMHQLAPLAAKLLPVPVHRILAAHEQILADRVSEAIAEATSQVHRYRVLAKGMEIELEKLHPQNPAGIEIGAKLYNPTNPGVYGNAFFLPDRVSALSPVRVSDLLGEPHEK